MTRLAVMVAAYTLLLCAAVRATPTAQSAQRLCDFSRIRAWKGYTSCVDAVVAEEAKARVGGLLEIAKFAKCRHTYFKNWTAFQAKVSLSGSTCIGTRFTDNGDGTVTDALTGLVWEKKDNMDFTPNLADPHDADNEYTWCAGSVGSCTNPTDPPDGTAFTSFLETLNSGGGFAGANGWRLPTLPELQSIMLDYPCTGTGGGPTCQCGSIPCVDAVFGPTNRNNHWSATSYLPDPNGAWTVGFPGDIPANGKTSSLPVRAVRGGL